MSNNSETYTTIAGDTWDVISWKVYASEYYIDTLILANQDHKYTAIFSAGVELVIPSVEGDRPDHLPPWSL